MSVINWLNANQGFVICLLTLVYVIATIVIVYYNRRSIKEMKDAREAESRPYIFAYLHKDPRDLCFYLRIKNFGKNGGKIKNISITPDMKFVENGIASEFLKNVIFAPDQMLYFLLLERNAETSKSNYSIEITYTAIQDENKMYTEQYSLVTQYADKMGYTDNKTSNLSDEANALQNIASHLDSIRNRL